MCRAGCIWSLVNVMQTFAELNDVSWIQESDQQVLSLIQYELRVDPQHKMVSETLVFLLFATSTILMGGKLSFGQLCYLNSGLHLLVLMKWALLHMRCPCTSGIILLWSLIPLPKLVGGLKLWFLSVLHWHLLSYQVEDYKFCFKIW
jgi:hypothetical protein